MRSSLIYFLLIGFLFSCKPKEINQKVNKQREGLWVENYGQDSLNYKSVGSYHNGDPINKWMYYLNGKRIKKENYFNVQDFTTPVLVQQHITTSRIKKEKINYDSSFVVRTKLIPAIKNRRPSML